MNANKIVTDVFDKFQEIHNIWIPQNFDLLKGTEIVIDSNDELGVIRYLNEKYELAGTNNGVSVFSYDFITGIGYDLTHYVKFERKDTL